MAQTFSGQVHEEGGGKSVIMGPVGWAGYRLYLKTFDLIIVERYFTVNNAQISVKDRA